MQPTIINTQTNTKTRIVYAHRHKHNHTTIGSKQSQGEKIKKQATLRENLITKKRKCKQNYFAKACNKHENTQKYTQMNTQTNKENS